MTQAKTTAAQSSGGALARTAGDLWRKLLGWRPLAYAIARLRAMWSVELDLGRVGMVVSVPVICWLFYTTASGMIDIMQRDSQDKIGLIGTGIATTAVLVMLTATSWSLGADLAALIARRRMARERMIVKTLVTAAVFLFVFSISAFFSFTYYYNNIFKLSSKRIVAELQPMELAADALMPATKDMARRYDEGSAKILATPSFKAYAANLGALVEAGRHAGPALRESVRKAQEAQQQASLAAARQAGADLEDEQSALRQIDDVKEQIASLERSILGLDAIIKAKQDEIGALGADARREEQEAVDASKGLDGRGAACGPNCLSHRVKANEMKRRAATIRETLAAPSNERMSLSHQRDALAARIATLRQKADASALAARRAPPPLQAPPDIDALTRELAKLQDEIRVDPTWARVRAAKPLCESLLGAARRSGADAALAQDFSCEPAGVDARDLLSARDATLAARVAYDAKCALDGPVRAEMGAIVERMRSAQASDPGAAGAGFAAAKNVVDGCLVLGKTAGLEEEDVRALLKKSDAYLRGHTSERNKFELAREAFLSFTPDSTMAICVAMAQDLFVFIMKFLSEIFRRGMEARERRQFVSPMDLTDVDSEPPEARAMKAIIRAARPAPGDLSEIDPEAPTLFALPSNVRDNAHALLNRMVRDEIAHIDRRGVYLVDNATIAQVEQKLASALRSRWTTRRDMRIDAQDNAPRVYYSDSAASAARRRPSPVERYLVGDAAGEGSVSSTG